MHHMVIQKRPPHLGWWLGDPTRHQVRNRSLGEFDSEFEQLAMNPGRTPERIGLGHFSNKVKDFRADRRPPGAFGSGLELPEQLESHTMPPNDRFGFDDDQWLLPIGPKTGKQDPEETVSTADLRPFNGMFHGGQLLSKREVLQNNIKSLIESEKKVKKPDQRHFHNGLSVDRSMLKSQ